jgi:hypothetical protein
LGSSHEAARGARGALRNTTISRRRDATHTICGGVARSILLTAARGKEKKARGEGTKPHWVQATPITAERNRHQTRHGPIAAPNRLRALDLAERLQGGALLSLTRLSYPEWTPGLIEGLLDAPVPR